MSFRRARVPDATWAIRPRLPTLALDHNIVLAADDLRIAALAAVDWSAKVSEAASRLNLLAGGIAAWTAVGYVTEGSENVPPDTAYVDYLFLVYDRHDGNKAAARRYLAWGTGSLAQLDAQEFGAFRLGAAATQP